MLFIFRSLGWTETGPEHCSHSKSLSCDHKPSVNLQPIVSVIWILSHNFKCWTRPWVWTFYGQRSGRFRLALLKSTARHPGSFSGIVKPSSLGFNFKSTSPSFSPPSHREPPAPLLNHILADLLLTAPTAGLTRNPQDNANCMPPLLQHLEVSTVSGEVSCSQNVSPISSESLQDSSSLVKPLLDRLKPWLL